MIVYNKRVPLVLTSSANIASPLAVATTWGVTRNWRLVMVCCHFSAAVTETFTVSLDHASGASYDTVFKTTSLTGATDTSYLPENDLILPIGYDIAVAVTSATATGTVYYTIVGEELN